MRRQEGCVLLMDLQLLNIKEKFNAHVKQTETICKKIIHYIAHTCKASISWTFFASITWSSNLGNINSNIWGIELSSSSIREEINCWINTHYASICHTVAHFYSNLLLSSFFRQYILQYWYCRHVVWTKNYFSFPVRNFSTYCEGK